MKVVNLNEKFSLIQEHWQPKIAGEFNDAYLKLVKFKGEFLWHRHETEDELFLVVEGNLTIKLRDRDLQLAAGEFAVIPRGVEHMPVAVEEAHVVLIEPKTTLNTGDLRTDRTLPELERI
ncbi:MAG TPA: cupin domain-containing protein [Pyrinomonadaceae bacterium]|nr:cupin domain-containing protein [Pyrinomonadaceae bacterium]